MGELTGSFSLLAQPEGAHRAGARALVAKGGEGVLFAAFEGGRSGFSPELGASLER